MNYNLVNIVDDNNCIINTLNGYLNNCRQKKVSNHHCIIIDISLFNNNILSLIFLCFPLIPSALLFLHLVDFLKAS